MRRFEVMQMQDDLWSVMDQGRVLYWYAAEGEARDAALALASESCRSGLQATVVITPAEAKSSLGSPQHAHGYTGM